jgi:hypothetical protein
MPSSRKPPPNTITRSTLDAALGELIVNQRGIDFQRIGVRLARERCPAVVASDVSKDGGEDAYLLATLSDGKMLSVATSITATLNKVPRTASAVRIFRPSGGRAARLRGNVHLREHIRRSRHTASAQELFQLADFPPERGIDWWM